MILYLTIGEQPSGIYTGQVIDVVRFMRTSLFRPVRLVAFVSGRNFFNTRKKIKQLLPGSIVFPMYPGLVNWQKNRFVLYLLCIIFRPGVIIGRNVIAAKLALLMRDRKLVKKVVLDGRGALAAEWKEYDVVPDEVLKDNIYTWEKEAVLHSDRQIAVSGKLIDYWNREFGFKKNSAVVIPCTINQSFQNLQISEESISASRSLLSIDNDRIVLVYAGSVAGWQSFSLLSDFLTGALKKDDKVVVCFLSKKTKEIGTLANDFPGRVFQHFAKPEDVAGYLIGCDYGLLIRERNTTNEVASPVKFAEYLSCGLKVIISEGIGDYSDLVKKEKCGFLLNNSAWVPERTGMKERLKNQELANKLFTKNNYIREYSMISEAAKV